MSRTLGVAVCKYCGYKTITSGSFLRHVRDCDKNPANIKKLEQNKSSAS